MMSSEGSSAENSASTSCGGRAPVSPVRSTSEPRSDMEQNASASAVESQSLHAVEGAPFSMQSLSASTDSEQSSALPTASGYRPEQRRRPLRHRGTCLLGEMRRPMPVQGQSFCECPKKSRDMECKCGEEDTVFDWVWDSDTKSSATVLSENQRDVRFHINYSSGTAAVRGTKKLTDRQCFWEIKMTTPVYGTDMMVGVGTESVILDASRQNFCSLLGRDSESWGLSYYGRLQHKNHFRTLPDARFGQGTIIGAHLDMWHGTLSFYKNRRPLGVAYRGLAGKVLYPMLSSTAARTGMRVTKSCSFETSLQFFCCQVLRKMVPAHLDVTDALNLPPGLQAFLVNNLSWLLRPSELSVEARQNRKRSWSRSDSEDSSEDEQIYKRSRTRASSDEETDLP